MQRVFNFPIATQGRGIRNPVAVYIAVLASAVAVVSSTLFASGWRVSSPVIVAGLALVAFVAERANVALAHRVVVSIALLPALFAAVLLGPLAAMIVYSASAVSLGFPVAGRVTYALNRALV